jgi:ubiquinone/menaquinone biosynthesis C-methylase UbiE
MPDVYATITEAAPEVQARLADVIEMRAADPRQGDMLKAYLSEIAFPPGAAALEIGCGTGAVTRVLARWPNVARAVGIDPSPVFLARARELSRGIDTASFEQGDGRALPFGDASFDVVVVHTAISHVPQPERLLAEAKRVLRAEGWLAVFDGDYATATVARGARDPLEACIHAFREDFVHDAWVMRRMPGLMKAAGFRLASMRSHGYVEAPTSGYMMTWIDRGADALARMGQVSPEGAAALKAEAKGRDQRGEWFGHIAFASALARPA